MDFIRYNKLDWAVFLIILIGEDFGQRTIFYEHY